MFSSNSYAVRLLKLKPSKIDGFKMCIYVHLINTRNAMVVGTRLAEIVSEYIPLKKYRD